MGQSFPIIDVSIISEIEEILLKDEIYYRLVKPKYKDSVLLPSGIAGRFNLEKIKALYASKTQNGAEEEFRQKKALEDKVLIEIAEIRVNLSKVVDLTHPLTQKKLKIDRSKIATIGEWQLPQQIGSIFYQRQWEGMIVPSALSLTENNLVMFPNNFLGSSNISVVNQFQILI